MKIKSLLKVILASILTMIVVSCFSNVKAVTITTDSTKTLSTDSNSQYVTNKGNLTVTGIKEGDSLAAYKILDAYYNATTNIVSYDFTDSFKAFLNSTSGKTPDYSTLTVAQYTSLTSGDITTGSVTTDSTLDTLVSSYATYLKSNSVASTAIGSNGTANVEAGAYLILPTTAKNIYAVMVGNIDFDVDTDGTTWKLNDETIVAKVSDAGVITKAVDSTSTSFNIGEEFSYKLTATVPAYPTNAKNRKYVITDTVDSTIEITESSIAITGYTISSGKIMKDSEEIGTVSFDSSTNKITIEITHAEKIGGTTLNISYNAKLKDTAGLGNSAGNANTASLTYSNDPYGTGTTTSEASTATVYTYGIEVHKVDSSDSTKLLPGAEFDVYSDSGLNTKIGTITTNTNGIGQYKGLKAGTYYLKETKAPTGYTLVSDTITVKVAIDGATEVETTGYYLSEVPNPKGLTLPFTGGTGTIIFTVAGLLIVLVASVIYIKSRKK